MNSYYKLRGTWKEAEYLTREKCANDKEIVVLRGKP